MAKIIASSLIGDIIVCTVSIVCLPNGHAILNTLKIKQTFQSVPGRIFLFTGIEQGVF